MRWWRIADQRYAFDRTGQGMAINGGRWNPRGKPAVYAAESVALTALEKWVHLSGIIPTRPYALVAIDVPDENGLILEVHAEQLPANWSAMPSSQAAERFGDHLFGSGGEAQTLGFTVPSAIVPENRNLVLNPAHPRMQDVTFAVVREFNFDDRMLKEV